MHPAKRFHDSSSAAATCPPRSVESETTDRATSAVKLLLKESSSMAHRTPFGLPCRRPSGNCPATALAAASVVATPETAIEVSSTAAVATLTTAAVENRATAAPAAPLIHGTAAIPDAPPATVRNGAASFFWRLKRSSNSIVQHATGGVHAEGSRKVQRISAKVPRQVLVSAAVSSESGAAFACCSKMRGAVTGKLQKVAGTLASELHVSSQQTMDTCASTASVHPAARAASSTAASPERAGASTATAPPVGTATDSASTAEFQGKGCKRKEAFSGSAYETPAASAVRPWMHLPEPLLLQILEYGGKEIAMTCRRFAAVVRRRRKVLRFSGDSSVSSSAEALITAIMSSPSLRLLEVTAGGGFSAAQLERLSRVRSSALPHRLQVLVMRRCSRLSDKGLRNLLLRLRELRCVDLRDSFSLTDEALCTLGLLPHLERVALGLTAGARGCCRLTCRTLRALFTPQQRQKQQVQDQHQEQQRENAVAPVKFLSLARCSEMKDFSVLACAARTLEFLDLRGTAIDDSSASVFSSLPNLQVLVLADTAVTTVTVSAIVDSCPNLQMLDLSCTGPVSRDCLFRLALSLQSISRLKLSHAAAIDDGLLAHLLAELRHLRFLDVSHCWRVTSAFCESPFTIAAGKQLRRLGLFGCNVERQKVESALILAGAANARLSLHNEMALFEMPRVYATMKGLDI